MREQTYKNSHLIEDDGIIFFQLTNEHIDLEIVKGFTEERLDFTNKKDSIYLVETGVKSITGQARDFLGSKEETQNVIAVAIFTNLKLTLYIGNFFIKVNLINNNVPMKMFMNKDEAIKWLRQFR